MTIHPDMTIPPEMSTPPTAAVSDAAGVAGDRGVTGDNEVGNWIAALSDWYHQVAAQHFIDLPVCNPTLTVEVTAFQRCAEGWLGAVIAPWSMFAVLWPEPPSHWDDQKAGQAVTLALPAANCPFTVEREAGLGTYLSSPLFSPMFQFTSQMQAREVARIAIATLLTALPAATPASSDNNNATPNSAVTDSATSDNTRAEEPKALSRRGIWRGLVSGTGDTL